MTASVPVFIVEDAAPMQAALRDLLQAVGRFEVAGIAAGEREAIEWLAANPTGWGVAILDLLLCEGSGFGLLRRLRSANPAGHVVVFSEFATEQLRAKCIALGANAAFLKSELPEFLRHLEQLAPAAAQVRSSQISVWSVVRRRGHDRHLGVRSMTPAGDLATCAWFDADGKIATATFPTSELEPVRALESDDGRWLDAFRAARGEPRNP